MRVSRVFLVLPVVLAIDVSARSAAAQAKPASDAVFYKTPAGFPNPLRISHAAKDIGAVNAGKYYSTTLGAWRKMIIYTPPGYNAKNPYPVLYLLHGLNQSYKDWSSTEVPPPGSTPEAVAGFAGIILDNLVYQKKIGPMVVVMPENSGSLTSDPTETDYRNFEAELINDLVPTINKMVVPKLNESHEPIRALAGLSEGAEQALKFGWDHPEMFRYVGAFSPGEDLVGDHYKSFFPLPAGGLQSDSQVPFIWMSCGLSDNKAGTDQDHLPVANDVDLYLDSLWVQHTYVTLTGDHEWSVWQASLHYFALWLNNQ
jgi:enterochelin esterase-like enzyme